MVNTKKLFKTALEGVVSSSLVATMLLTQLNLGVRATNSAPSAGMFIEKTALGAGTTYGLVSGKTLQKVYFGKNPDFDKEPTDNTTPKQLTSDAADQGWYIVGYDSTTGGLVLLCDPLQPMSDAALIGGDGGTNAAKGGMPFLPQAKYESLTLTGDSSAQNYNKAAYNRDPANPENELDWDCTYQDFTPEAGTTRVFANHFGGSDIWAKIKEYQAQTNRFSTAEQALMKDTTVTTLDKKNNKNYTTTSKLYLGSGTYNQKRAKFGASDNLEVGLVAAEAPTDSTAAYSVSGNAFWLRSPNASVSYRALYAVTGNSVGDLIVYGSYRCVPACALNLESVIFASAAAPAAASSSALSDGVYLRVANPTENPKISTSATATNNTITVNKAAEGDADNVYLYVQGKDDTNDWVYSEQLTASKTINASTVHTGLTSLENCKVWIETTVDNVTYAKMPNAEVTTAPTAKTLTYTGQAQALVNEGTATNGTMQYKLGTNGTYGTAIPEATNAGTYTVYYKAVGSDGFEDSAEASVNVTIAKKALTVTADNKTVTYGSDAPDYTVTYSGFENNETSSVLSGTLSYTHSYTSSSNVGTYDITPSGLTSSNYNITFTKGTLTVNKANINPTVTLADWIVGGTASAPSVSGNSGNGAVTYNYKVQDAADSTYSTEKPTAAGSYTVKAAVAATDNYNAGTATANFVVKQKMYITLKNEYGGTVTNVDGITLSAGSTDLTHVGNGVFETEGLAVGDHTLTITVGTSSSYFAPEATTYTISNDADHPSSADNPCRIIKLRQVEVKTGRVITGVGGDAGYKYDRVANRTVFYCKPAEGYKVDKIEKDSKGVVKYVSFKTL